MKRTTKGTRAMTDEQNYQYIATKIKAARKYLWDVLEPGHPTAEGIYNTLAALDEIKASVLELKGEKDEITGPH